MRYEDARRIWAAVILQALQDVRNVYFLKKRGRYDEPKGDWQFDVKRSGDDAVSFFLDPYRKIDLMSICDAAGFCHRTATHIAEEILAGNPEILKRFTLRGGMSLRKLRLLRRSIQNLKIKQKELKHV